MFKCRMPTSIAVATGIDQRKTKESIVLVHHLGDCIGFCTLFTGLATKSRAGKVATIGSKEYTRYSNKATFAL
jgi:hypothetical protein